LNFKRNFFTTLAVVCLIALVITIVIMGLLSGIMAKEPITDIEATPEQALYVPLHNSINVPALPERIKDLPNTEEDCNPPNFEYRQYTQEEIDMMAQMVWGEARGTTRYEQKLVVWVVLQRVMSDCGCWPDTIAEVITQNRQFHGFRPSFPVDERLREVVVEVLEYWASGGEPKTLYPYAPTLPYYFFRGDGRNNWFRLEW